MSTIEPVECAGGGALRPISCGTPSVPPSPGTLQHQQPTPPTTQGQPLGNIIVLGTVPSGGSPFGAQGFIPTVPGEGDPSGGGGPGVFVPLDPGPPEPPGTLGPPTSTPGGPPPGTIGPGPSFPKPPSGTLGPIGTTPGTPRGSITTAVINFGIDFHPGAVMGPGTGNF